jgi:hypothetical protein
MECAVKGQSRGIMNFAVYFITFLKRTLLKKGERVSRPQPEYQRAFSYSDIPVGDGKIANLFLQCRNKMQYI